LYIPSNSVSIEKPELVKPSINEIELPFTSPLPVPPEIKSYDVIQKTANGDFLREMVMYYYHFFNKIPSAATSLVTSAFSFKFGLFEYL
jgi:hypothetical protein